MVKIALSKGDNNIKGNIERLKELVTQSEHKPDVKKGLDVNSSEEFILKKDQNFSKLEKFTQGVLNKLFTTEV